MSALACASSSCFRLPAAQCTRSGRVQRQRLVCRAAQREEQAPLFQLDSRHTLSMADVRDAYEICSLIPDPNDRQQCYSVFGLDSQRMASYYETVVQLEDQLATDFHTAAATSSSTAAPGVVLSRDDPDDYFSAPAECSFTE